MSDAPVETKKALDYHFGSFHDLMPQRVQNVLLVSSLYESFILEQDGLLTELVTSEYLNMNLSHPPRIVRVSTGKEALEHVRSQPVDLIITMTRLSNWIVADFAKSVREIRPNLPIVILVIEPRELHSEALADRSLFDRIFVWHGDAKLLLAIIKSVEDRLNVDHDTTVGDVRVICLVENSVRFYSTYLPLIYTELVKLTQSLLAEGINPMQRLLRMRARPKILLAETFEEALGLVSKYKSNLLGIISDVRFPRGNKIDAEAGLELAKLIRAETPDMPILLQSSDKKNLSRAAEVGASFILKASPTLFQDLRHFILNNLGFGDFTFMLPDGTKLGQAHDLRSFEEMIARVPEESIGFHGRNNHFSNWLMARTEFEIAAQIRPWKVSDFKNLNELRSYLLRNIAEFRERTAAGLIAEFSQPDFDPTVPFARIGGGSIGGKARGLAFINALIRRYQLRYRFENVRIAVPRSVVIGTDIFDLFIESNELGNLRHRDLDSSELARCFLKASLPQTVIPHLMTFLGHTTCPIAVRSSSLLEDALDLPLAGIYATYMLPNNHPDTAVRLKQLSQAIKLVYASTFRRTARLHLQASGRQIEEEKMAVILQELIGSPHENRFYPTFSGVARSYNFYPAIEMKPEDGVATVALGLGKIIVEGGQGLIFCPQHPKVFPQFSTNDDMLAHSQRHFYTLNLKAAAAPCDDSAISMFNLDTAEKDGTLESLGSVYCAENDIFYDGIFRAGPRVVSFAHILKSEVFPLANILKTLLDLGSDAMACPVEIEFAVNLDTAPMEFGFLQIRPFNADIGFEPIKITAETKKNAICYSQSGMGNGRISDTRDLVVVKPSSFDTISTIKIASELAHLNEELRKQGRHYALIGPGRWGTADHCLGIPVTWEQISQARVIVETNLENFVVAPSQGAHFFQNLVTLRIGYLTVNPMLQEGFVDWNWLNAEAAFQETQFLKHIRLEKPLDIQLDGRSRQGIIRR